jgi:hypothetical protein
VTSENTKLVIKPAGEKSLAGSSHFVTASFGTHSLQKIPSVKFLTDTVSFTVRFLDELYLLADDVLILQYNVGNGLIQCFQLIDSVETWRKLGKRKKIKPVGLWVIKAHDAIEHSETFTLDAKRIIFCHKIDCPRCDGKVVKQDSKIHTCPNCKTRFTS